MAKSLLKHSDLSCNDPEEEDAPVGCDLIPLLYDIVNTQNSQIIDMRHALDQLQVEQYADCVVPFAQAATTRTGSSRGLRELQSPAFTHGVECTPCEGQDGDCTIIVKVDLLAGKLGT